MPTGACCQMQVSAGLQESCIYAMCLLCAGAIPGTLSHLTMHYCLMAFGVRTHIYAHCALTDFASDFLLKCARCVIQHLGLLGSPFMVEGSRTAAPVI